MAANTKDKGKRRNWEGLYCLINRNDPAVDGGAWVPPVDIYETGDSFMLDAELPGVDPACAEESYSCLEGSRGHFFRRFALPAKIDGGSIRTTLKDGVLHVILPKSSQ